MNTARKNRTREFVVLALLVGILFLMSFTPLGYLNVGPFAISFNVIPVAVAAIALGPTGGAVAGAVFGLTSFMQALGIGGASAMGAVLVSISPVRSCIQCFVPRILDGFIIGLVYNILRKRAPAAVACGVTGFLSAFLNTAFFMSSLIILFGSTEYMQGLIGGRNVIAFVCAFVGVNAVVEMLASTVITSAVGTALTKSGLIRKS